MSKKRTVIIFRILPGIMIFFLFLMHIIMLLLIALWNIIF